jgi:hypothetical protein
MRDALVGEPDDERLEPTTLLLDLDRTVAGDPALWVLTLADLEEAVVAERRFVLRILIGTHTPGEHTTLNQYERRTPSDRR